MYHCRGVRIKGQELFVGGCCHVRGEQGMDDEHTCEIDQLYENINGEMLAKVRWFYWPAELNMKRLKKLKNLPSFSQNEVLLSEEYSPVDIQTISKQCQVNSLPSSASIPNRTSKGTLYCKWRVTKGYKEIVPVIPTTPQPVRNQKEEHKNEEDETKTKTTTLKKRKISPNMARTAKKKPRVHTPTRKHKAVPVHKEDTSLFEMARERYSVHVCNR